MPERMRSRHSSAGYLACRAETGPIPRGYQFAKSAFQVLSKEKEFAQWAPDDDEQLITLTAPKDLQDRLRQLPREVIDANHCYVLSAKPDRVAESIETARQARAEDDTWPHLHYLWPQHPIMDWLLDRVLTQFGRHRAPVIQNPYLELGEQAFILMGLVPNRKGQPLLVDWQVATRKAGGAMQLENYDSFVVRAKLKADVLPNRGIAFDTTDLQAELPEAVAAMRAHMIARQCVFDGDIKARLAGTLAELEVLQGKQVQQLELRLENLLEGVRESKREQRSKQINQVFDEYRQWVADTMTTEPQPYIRLLAALTR